MPTNSERVAKDVALADELSLTVVNTDGVFKDRPLPEERARASGRAALRYALASSDKRKKATD